MSFGRLALHGRAALPIGLPDLGIAVAYIGGFVVAFPVDGDLQSHPQHDQGSGGRMLS